MWQVNVHQKRRLPFGPTAKNSYGTIPPESFLMDIRQSHGLAFCGDVVSAFTSARIIVADASPLWRCQARYLISGLLGVGIALGACQHGG